MIEALIVQIISKSVEQRGLVADEKWRRDGIQLERWIDTMRTWDMWLQTHHSPYALQTRTGGFYTTTLLLLFTRQSKRKCHIRNVLCVTETKLCVLFNAACKKVLPGVLRQLTFQHSLQAPWLMIRLAVIQTLVNLYNYLQTSPNMHSVNRCIYRDARRSSNALCLQ